MWCLQTSVIHLSYHVLVSFPKISKCDCTTVHLFPLPCFSLLRVVVILWHEISLYSVSLTQHRALSVRSVSCLISCYQCFTSYKFSWHQVVQKVTGERCFSTHRLWVAASALFLCDLGGGGMSPAALPPLIYSNVRYSKSWEVCKV